MKDEPRIAVYSGTRNVYEDLTTAAKSMIAHDGCDRIYFLTEDDVFPEKLPDMIETINFSRQTYIRPGSVNWGTPFTYMASGRVAYPDIFRQYDRVLSLDMDTIVCGSLDGIWGTYLDDVYFAAVNERHMFPTSGIQKTDYYNIGVTLMNLKKMRDDGLWEKAVTVLNNERWKYVDQDVLNELCAGWTRTLPWCYNYCPMVMEQRILQPEQIRIRHYAGDTRFNYHEKELWLKWYRTSWDEALEMNRKCKAERRNADAEPEGNGTGDGLAEKQDS